VADLMQTFDIDDEVLDEPAEGTVTDEPVYGRSWLFDFNAGDFITSGGRVAEADGYQAWVQWCVKAALTERDSYLIYDDDYGTDYEELRTAGARAASEDLIADSITEALMVDPRTGSVTGFDFAWQGDQIHVSFELTPALGTTQRVEIVITA
jgi:hypothetical protein